jgi:hypothetical protein
MLGTDDVGEDDGAAFAHSAGYVCNAGTARASRQAVTAAIVQSMQLPRPSRSAIVRAQEGPPGTVMSAHAVAKPISAGARSSPPPHWRSAPPQARHQTAAIRVRKRAIRPRARASGHGPVATPRSTRSSQCSSRRLVPVKRRYVPRTSARRQRTLSRSAGIRSSGSGRTRASVSSTPASAPQTVQPATSLQSSSGAPQAASCRDGQTGVVQPTPTSGTSSIPSPHVRSLPPQLRATRYGTRARRSSRARVVPASGQGPWRTPAAASRSHRMKRRMRARAYVTPARAIARAHERGLRAAKASIGIRESASTSASVTRRSECRGAAR